MVRPVEESSFPRYASSPIFVKIPGANRGAPFKLTCVPRPEFPASVPATVAPSVDLNKGEQPVKIEMEKEAKAKDKDQEPPSASPQSAPTVRRRR